MAITVLLPGMIGQYAKDRLQAQAIGRGNVPWV
jgi:hypothetical protein